MFRLKINQILCLIIIAILCYMIFLENSRNTETTNQVESFVDNNDNNEEFLNISNQKWFKENEWTVVNPMDHEYQDKSRPYRSHFKNGIWDNRNNNLLKEGKVYPHHHPHGLGYLDSHWGWFPSRYNHKDKPFPSIIIDSYGNQKDESKNENHKLFKDEIVGVLVQGYYHDGSYHPTKLQIDGSHDNKIWTNKIWDGNTGINNTNTTKYFKYKFCKFDEDKQKFRYIRVIQTDWNNQRHPIIRVGLVVKKDQSYYEVYNPSYKNRSHSSIFAGQKNGAWHGGQGHGLGRLNSPLAWCAWTKNNAQWTILQKNNQEMNVAGVVIQGRGGGNQWSLGYIAQYPKHIQVETSNSENGPWKNIQLQHNGKTGIHKGNYYSCSTGTDHYRILKFKKGMKKCKYVRITIKDWHHHPSMRSGLLLEKELTEKSQINAKTYNEYVNEYVKEGFELDKETIKRENAKQELVLNTFLQ